MPHAVEEALASIDELLDHLDSNKTGTVTLDEWLAFVVDRLLTSHSRLLHQVFVALDVDKDGRITYSDLSHYTQSTVPVSATMLSLAQLVVEAYDLRIRGGALPTLSAGGSIDFVTFFDMWHHRVKSGGKVSLQRAPSVYY